MHSIRFRLIALFILLVTLTLAGFGVYGQLRLSRELEQSYAERQKAVLLRLTTSLPAGVWNYDAFQSKRIILAEMGSPEVESVAVFDSKSQAFVSSARENAGVRATASHPATQTTVQAMLYIDPVVEQAPRKGDGATSIGRLEVVFSRAHIDAALRAAMVHRVVEILVLDGILVIALIVSLNMVFKPIAQLRDALFELATHHGEEAEELPETSRTEFGEVVRGFNQTQRKLRQVIARRTQAEEAARDAAAKTDLAYRDLQAAQDSLVQSEKLAGLGGMVAGVAHEINTPVGVLLTSASVLNQATVQTSRAMAEGAVRKSDMVAYLETASESARLILNNAERAAHLIQSFKQVAVDQTSEQRRTFELQNYLEELTTSLHPALKKAHADVKVVCADSIQMDSYPGLLAQVLTNLTMNAITHAFAPEQQGHIVIQVACVDDRVSIAFSDDGQGIAPENMGRIFDPFFTTRRGQGGSGLGLHIVFNIVTKQLGGTIAVRNAEHQGACFDMVVPRVTPPIQKSETA
jgi:two-component system NtrC family sensor kinase